MAPSKLKPLVIDRDHSDKALKLLENSTLITITVGSGSLEEIVKWTLPKTLLTCHSRFFDAALNGPFQEAASGTLSLPEDNPKVFRLFVRWLFIGNICENGECSSVTDSLLVNAWTLGDKLGSDEFSNGVMAQIVEKFQIRRVYPTLVEKIYQCTMPGSMLRAWVVAQFCLDQQEGCLSKSPDSWAGLAEKEKDFGADIVKALALYCKRTFPDPGDCPNAYFQGTADGG